MPFRDKHLFYCALPFVLFLRNVYLGIMRLVTIAVYMNGHRKLDDRIYHTYLNGSASM